MKYFLDTEFVEYPCTIDLISIGIVAEDGREFYAISDHFNEALAGQWVRENVISKLGEERRQSRADIVSGILSFVNDKKPEFWGYYSDYDWVVFCWLFGTMMQLPTSFPKYCNDVKQLCVWLGNPQLPEMKGKEHNALEDAKWTMKCYDFLMERDYLCVEPRKKKTGNVCVQDGIVADADFKSPCCKADVKPYQAHDYPYDSGMECTKCRRQWSVLQISRGDHLWEKRRK